MLREVVDVLQETLEKHKRRTAKILIGAVVIALFLSISLSILQVFAIRDRADLRETNERQEQVISNQQATIQQLVEQNRMQRTMLDARAEIQKRNWRAVERAGLLTDEDKQRFKELFGSAEYDKAPNGEK